MAHTNNTTNTNIQPTTDTTLAIRGIHTDTEAQTAISAIAEANPRLVDRDMDALWELGEADMGAVFDGYLWHEVEVAFLGMDEDTNSLLASAIVDFYCDQMADMEEAVEEYEEDEEDPDMEEYYEARLACEEASSLYGADSEEYEEAYRVFCEVEARVLG